jgi:hypothetical protein
LSRRSSGGDSFLLQRIMNSKENAKINESFTNMEIVTNFEVVKSGKHIVDQYVNP